MARDYARIMTAIWRNREFRSLCEAPQRAYLMLVTQPDISAAGVLPLRPRRWAELSADSKPESIVSLLMELEAGRFIVLDQNTEEVLVRSFIRWDGGFNNPKRRPVIIRSAEEVDSPKLRRALRLEFERCGLPPLASDGASDRPSDAPSGRPQMANGADALDLISDEPFPQVDRLSDSPSDSESPSDGVVVTYLSTTDTTTHNPQTVPPSAGAAPHAPRELALVPAIEPINAGHVVAAWAEAFATTGNKPVPRLRAQVGKEARELLEAGNEPDRVLAAARVLGTKGRATLVTELAIQTAPALARATAAASRPATTDVRFAAALALADMYPEED